MISVPVPPGTRGKDCAVNMSKTHLSVGLKGQAPILAGDLEDVIIMDDSMWSVVMGKEAAIEVTLTKARGMCWWTRVVKGEPEINTRKVK